MRTDLKILEIFQPKIRDGAELLEIYWPVTCVLLKILKMSSCLFNTISNLHCCNRYLKIKQYFKIVVVTIISTRSFKAIKK